MSTEDPTVQIPCVPQPAATLWLGIAAAAAGASWLATLATMFANKPTQGQLLAAGLCASVTISIIAVSAWARYSLAKAASDHHHQLALLVAGQHALVVAEAHRNRVSTEEAAGQACIERQAISLKLTKVMEEMPSYWHEVADGIQQELAEPSNNVRAIGRTRGPRS
jgi:hypothetical protein